MNAKEKVQASFDMIKEHIEKGGSWSATKTGLSNMSSAAQP